MTEDEFWQTHTVLSNEAEATEESYYVLKEVNSFADQHPDALRLMNYHPLFWAATAHAHQTNFVITIGRIFDRDPRSHSIHKLLQEAVDHPEFLSKDALRRRKLVLSPSFDPAALAEYIAQSWEPDVEALEALRKDFQPVSDKYDVSFKLIRHKLFAHQDVLSKRAIQALVSKGLFIDFEAILYGVRDLLECILQLGFNGTKPTLGLRRYGLEDRIRTETRKVLDYLLTSQTPPGQP